MSVNGFPEEFVVLAMSELDRVREQIAYLKYWQGIMVVTDISLIGWLMTVPGPQVGIFALAFGGAIALTCGIYLLHRLIDRRIDELGRL
jgi:4-hydroxybenzoate polyprenyltransferase